MSTLGDLTSRVKRFGKTPNTVPGTYMSAAGVQTEIHPTTLARLAVHETLYRRQVHVYQQDLESTVHKIRKDQIVLKRSYGEYKRKLDHNQKNKYVSPFYSASGESNFSTSTWSTTSEVLSGAVKVVRRGGKKVRIVLPSLEKKDSKQEFEHGIREKARGKSENPQDETLDSPADGKATENDTDKTDESMKEHLQKEMLSSLTTEQSGDRGQLEKEISLQKTRTRAQGGLEHVRKSKNPKGKKIDKKQLRKSKDDFEETLPPDVPQTEDTKDDIEKGNDTITKEKVGNNSFVTHKDSVVMVMNRSKPPEKHASSKRSENDTLTFMELVRMKNKHGLVKNMKVVDELIQHSKTRSFAYLTKVSESREDLLREKERETSDSSSEEKLELQHNSQDFTDMAHPVIAVTDEVDKDTDKSVTLSDIMSLDGSTTRLTNEAPRRNRKTNVILAPDTEKLPYMHRDGTNFSLFASRNPNQLLPGRSQLKEVPISKRVTLPSRKVDKFLKDEKAKSSNYKSDVSWQQSLASIKDVHYLRNKDDFQDFAKSVIRE